MIDPARLRPIDRLRLLEQLDDNIEWQATLKELEEQLTEQALLDKSPGDREAARAAVLAIRHLRADIRGRKRLYRAEHEREMAEAKSKAA